jgi:hypothetical protein
MGKGNLTDSTATEYIDAELSPSGIRGKFAGSLFQPFLLGQ